MKKKLIAILCFIIFPFIMFAQNSSYGLLPDPAQKLRANLNAECSIKKVKTRNEYTNKSGKPVLDASITFKSNGKIASEQHFGFARKLSYTYSGDTTIKTTVTPDMGRDGDEIMISVDKFNSKGQILFGNTYVFYSDHPADSMKTPKFSTTYNYKDGLLLSTVNNEGETEIYTYDSHGKETEIKSGDKTKKYFPVYEGDKLTANSYSENNEVEYLFEKLYYNSQGLIIKYETYNKGILSSTKNFEYNAAKKVITELDKCSSDKYTYNAAGSLIKDESVGCDKSVSSSLFTYNAAGLLASVVYTDSGKSKTETFVYTYWK